LAQINGNKITSECKDRLSKLHKGDMVIIANVKAVAPDGTIVKTSGATYTVQ